MEKWVVINTCTEIDDIAKKYGISPIVAGILKNRNIEDPEMENFLSPGPKCFHDPFMLKGMDRVVSVLHDRIEAGEKIRIIGDYDVDGICATYILFRGITLFGGDTDCVIPHRIEDGYGISSKMVEAAHNDGRNTIITCDNGISATEQVKLANELDMTVIVTDHHEVPYEDVGGEKYYKLPDADALTDPKLPGDEYPFKGICGAFVALKVLESYARKYGFMGREDFSELARELTEFAALATVCDVMELKDENRALVRMGLRFMEKSRNLGLKALLECTGMTGKQLSPYHCGFVIGPCFNASGRLDTSLKALSLITEKDPAAAKEKALALTELNESRKTMTLEWSQKAFDAVDAMDDPDNVLVLYLPGCHESLAGIIAGKVKEKYQRPTFVLTDAEQGLKGSGRSIEAYDMYEGLVRADSLLTKYGGHKMAAGVSLEKENLEAFRKNLNDNAALSKDDLCETVKIDCELSVGAADLNLARELTRLEPFGNGNESPLFMDSDVTFISGSRIGKTGNFGKYRVLSKDGRIFEMVYFGNAEDLETYTDEKYGEGAGKKLHSGVNVSYKFDVCYGVEINSYKGTERVQLRLKHYR